MIVGVVPAVPGVVIDVDVAIPAVDSDADTVSRSGQLNLIPGRNEDPLVVVVVVVIDDKQGIILF